MSKEQRNISVTFALKYSQQKELLQNASDHCQRATDGRNNAVRMVGNVNTHGVCVCSRFIKENNVNSNRAGLALVVCLLCLHRKFNDKL